MFRNTRCLFGVSLESLEIVPDRNFLISILESLQYYLSDTEFIHLLDIMENMRQNWNAEKLRADALQEQMNTREYDYR